MCAQVVVQNDGFINVCANVAGNKLNAGYISMCSNYRGMLEVVTLGDMMIAAISSNDTSMLNFTLKEKVPSSEAEKGILLACELGLIKSLAQIVEAGYTPGEDAMRAACRNGHSDVVNLLLQKGGQMSEISRQLLARSNV